MYKLLIDKSIWLLISNIAIKVMAFLYSIYLAKTLSINDFGIYFTALTFFSLISAFTDLGLNRYISREVVINRGDLSQLITSVVIFRIIISFLSVIIFSFLLLIFDGVQNRIMISIIAVLTIIPQSVSLTIESIFIAFQKLKLTAIGLFLLTFINIIIGIFLVIYFNVTGAILAVLISHICYSILMVTLYKSIGIEFSKKINFDSLKNIIKGSIPYGLLGLLGLLYFKVDILLLTYMRGEIDTAIYGVAYRFLEATIFIPTVLSVALFPVITKLTIKSAREGFNYYLKASKFFLIISIPIVFAFLLILPIFIRIFLPNYESSIEVLRILSLSIPWIFLITIQSFALLSLNKYLKQIIYISIINLIINIMLNIYLIPKYSYYGSAWATVVSDVLGFSIMFIFIYFKFQKNETKQN